MEILIGGRVRDAVDVGRFGDVDAEVEVEVELDVDMEVLIGVGVGVDIGDTSLSCSSCACFVLLNGNVKGNEDDWMGGAAT